MKSGGFTLVETLIYTALVSIVITGFITFALLVSGLSTKNFVIEEVNANARIAINLISQKIRQAEEIVSPIQGTASSTLILKMPDESLITFSLVGDSLVLDEEGVRNNVISNKVLVKDLNFINLANISKNDNIKTTFNIEYNNALSMEYNCQQSYQTAVSLRR